MKGKREPTDQDTTYSDTRELHPAPSGPRPHVGQAPAPWLDSLLTLSLELDHTSDYEALSAQVVDRIAELMPDCAVGACIAVPDASRSFTEIRMPPGQAASMGRDPTRLFPDLRVERSAMLGAGWRDSSLHLASDKPELLCDGGPRLLLLARAAQVLGTVLERARRLRLEHGSNADMQRLQARVIQAEKLASLGQIVAGLVHELNNPLTSIVAYSDYLRKKAERRQVIGDDGSDDIERLRRIGEAADRILKFSRELVAYARPSADVPGTVVLQDVVEKALVFCEHEFAKAGVTIKRHFDVDVPPVRGIAGQLTQVFVNLFTNAAHAMRVGSGMLEVCMECHPGADTVTVEVRDNGTGIDAEELTQIFEPFYTTKTDGQGTGLGLSIVRDIVEVHGGQLTASSVVGEGSVFSVILPLASIPKLED